MTLIKYFTSIVDTGSYYMNNYIITSTCLCNDDSSVHRIAKLTNKLNIHYVCIYTCTFTALTPIYVKISNG